MRVVIAEDQALLREGLVALLREHEHRGRRPGRGRPGPRSASSAATSPTWRSSTCGCRRPSPTRACAPRSRRAGATRPRRPDPLPVRRAGLHGRAAGVAARAASATCSRSGSATSPRSSTRSAASPRAAPRSTARSSPSWSRAHRRRRTAPARRALPARARGARADGRGPHQRGDRRGLVVTPGAVEKHVSNIFGKLDLAAGDDDHRRVLAVLAFLRAEDG